VCDLVGDAAAVGIGCLTDVNWGALVGALGRNSAWNSVDLPELWFVYSLFILAVVLESEVQGLPDDIGLAAVLYDFEVGCANIFLGDLWTYYKGAGNFSGCSCSLFVFCCTQIYSTRTYSLLTTDRPLNGGLAWINRLSKNKILSRLKIEGGVLG